MAVTVYPKEVGAVTKKNHSSLVLQDEEFTSKT